MRFMASIIGSGAAVAPARTAAWCTPSRDEPWIVSPQSMSSTWGDSRRTWATRVAAAARPRGAGWRVK